MQGHFKFGHTIKPQQIEPNSKSEDDLGQLFKIGNDKIQIKFEDQASHDSDETPRQNQTPKEKKVKKQKKKKEKKNKRRKDYSSNEDQSVEVKKEKPKFKQSQPSKHGHTQMVLFNENRSKKQMQLFKNFGEIKSVQQQLAGNSNLQFKIKLGDGLLNVDIMDFPQKELYRYGLMEKDVPQYTRFSQTQIMGFSANNQKKIIKQLNKIINQKNQNPNKDEIAKQRYFNYQGFQKIQSQKPPSIRPQTKFASCIPIATQIFTQSKEDETMLKINREFNSKLKQQPQNVSLWLEFIAVQRKCMSVVGNSNKTRLAIVQRQLSILQKALQLNPGQEKLACCYIETMLAKQTDVTLVIQKCVQFIRSKPHCIQLWRMYIKLKLGAFSFYSHQIARKVCEQVLRMVKGMIESARSAVIVWKLRKVSLQIIKTICRLYRLQGYGQLATAIIIALLQFNWFIPEDIQKIANFEQKVKAFGEYWQDHSRLKLCEVLYYNAPQSLSISLQESELLKIPPISCEQNVEYHAKNEFQKQLMLHKTIWRPSHPIIDRGIIKKRPESYILIEDIDFTLANFRDNDSIMALLDLLADHLQLPPVFTAPNLQSQFSLLVIQKAYNKIHEQKGDGWFAQSGCFWRSRFWNPCQTWNLFGSERIEKVQFFRRILMQIKTKIQTYNKQINVYLMFLACCYHLSPEVRKALKLDQSDALRLIEDLLRQQTLTAKVWSIYIHTTFMISNNVNECLQCWLQLFQSNKLMNNGIADVRLNQQIFFWLWQFVSVRQPQYNVRVVKLYLILLDERQIPKKFDDLELSHKQLERLERYLMQKVSFLLQQKITNQSELSFQNIQLLNFVLDIVKIYNLENLVPSKEKIIKLFLQKVKTGSSLQQTKYFILHILIHRKELSITQLKSNYTHLLSYLQVVKYWAQSEFSTLTTFTVQFQLSQLRSLPLWMALGPFLWLKYDNSVNFHQFFYKIAKKIAQQENSHDASYLILLNKLLIHDTKQIHYHFALQSLKKCPYSKQIHLFNLMISQSTSQALKLKSLLHQKGIRILDSEAFQ